MENESGFLSKFSTVAINIPAVSSKEFSLTIDGTPVKGVRKVVIEADYRQPTMVRVEFMANVTGTAAGNVTDSKQDQE